MITSAAFLASSAFLTMTSASSVIRLARVRALVDIFIISSDSSLNLANSSSAVSNVSLPSKGKENDLRLKMHEDKTKEREGKDNKTRMFTCA